MKLNFLKSLKQKFINRVKKAFSLNDLSVLMSTIAIVAVSAVAISNIQNVDQEKKADSKKIETIYKAIGNFLVQNKRLPCPASITRVRGQDLNYGIEEISAGNCSTGSGVYKISANNNLLYGAIPAQTLGLSSDFVQDQYGSKIVYIVDKRATYSSTSVATDNIGSIKDASIIVKENGVDVSTDSIFIVLANGKNKSNTFNRNSAKYKSTTNTNEAENGFSTSGDTITADGTYVKNGDTITADNIFIKSVKGDNEFDDEVFFKDREALISDFKADFLVPCKNAGDNYGNKNGVFGEIVYSSLNCPAPNQNITPAKKCGRDGKWVYEKSCPCYVEAEGIDPAYVPNGDGNIACSKANFSGVLKYSCSEENDTVGKKKITIVDACKRSCTFNASNNVVGLKNTITVPAGSSKVSCNQDNFEGEYIVTCENGEIKNQVGSCGNSTCLVGGYSGMKSQTVTSGTSGTLGICEQNGYSGKYSYTCADGVSSVSDFCYQDCQFSALGITATSLKHGTHNLSCNSGYLGNGVTLSCKDGVVSDISGSCYLSGNCAVGNGLGMVPKSAPYGTTTKTDGTCVTTDFSGNYSYSCSAQGISTTTNNCIALKCVVGEGAGMTSKSVNRGTSGEDGVCSSGYGGYYKWNCSSLGVGSVVENNCVNSCRVGKSSQVPSPQSGNGMIEDFVGYGKTGDQGLCDISNNYVGQYSWSCLVNSTTRKVEGLVTNNNCKNKCLVGTSIQGSGMVQKEVTIGSSGVNGECSSGYTGSFQWSCDSLGYSQVTNNKCVNRCLVGTSAQGTGMISKEVIFGTSGNDGICSDATGYLGTYSWACSADGIGTITANNCVLRSCTVGNGTGMNPKTVSAGTSGTGSCATGYSGSFEWACLFNGTNSVTNKCQLIKCNIPTSNLNLSKYSNLEYAENQQAIPCTTGFDGNVTYTCIKPVVNGYGTSTVSGVCLPITCTVPASAYVNQDSVNYSTTSTSGNLTCQTGYAGTPTYTCTTNGSSANFTASCVAIKCSSNGTSYTGLPSTTLTNLNFTGSSSGIVNCSGAEYTGTANYTCTGTTNPGNFAVTSSCACAGGYQQDPDTGSCAVTQCKTSIAGFVPNTAILYSTAPTYLYCNDPKYDNFFTTTFQACDTSKTLSPASTCGDPLTCSTTGLNVKQPSIFIGDGQTLTCNDGYSPTSITRNCRAEKATRPGGGEPVPHTAALSGTSGTCTPITCTVPATANANEASVNYSATSTSAGLTCKTGFAGTPTYTCTTNGASANFTANCAPITCTVPTTVNATQATVGFSTTPTTTDLTCKTGFTGSPNYTCTGITNPGTYTAGGTPCTAQAIACTVPSTTNTTIDGTQVNPTTTVTPLTCKPGFFGSPKYTCSATGTYATDGIPCTPIKCYAKDRVALAGTNYVDVVLSGSSEAMVANSSQTYIDNRVSSNMGRTLLPLVNRFKLYDVYHGGVSYVRQDTSWTFFGPINLSYVPKSANVSAFRSMSSSSIYYGVKSNHILTKYSRILDYGTNSFTCDYGYIGTLAYNCQTDGSTIDPSSGTCSMVTCNVPSSTNSTIDNTAVNFTSSPVSITCKSGFPGSPSYTCLPNGNSPTGTYVPGGVSCSANNCTVPATHNFNITSTGLATNATPVNCATGYAYGSTPPTYTCDTSTTPGTFTKVSGNCSRITCTVPASENTTLTGSAVDFSASPAPLTCASGLYGAPKYTCLSNGNSLSGLYTSVGIPCAPIKCYAKERVGFSGTNYFDNVSAGTGNIEAWSSLFRIYHENQSNTPYIPLVNRIKLFDVYHGPLIHQSQSAWYVFNFNPIDRSQFSKTSNPSYFIYQSPELYNVKSSHTFTKYARILNYGTNSFTCDSGTGTVTYNCQTDGSTLDPISGTCN